MPDMASTSLFSTAAEECAIVLCSFLRDAKPHSFYTVSIGTFFLRLIAGSKNFLFLCALFIMACLRLI